MIPVTACCVQAQPVAPSCLVQALSSSSRSPPPWPPPTATLASHPLPVPRPLGAVAKIASEQFQACPGQASTAFPAHGTPGPTPTEERGPAPSTVAHEGCTTARPCCLVHGSTAMCLADPRSPDRNDWDSQSSLQQMPAVQHEQTSAGTLSYMLFQSMEVVIQLNTCTFTYDDY